MKSLNPFRRVALLLTVFVFLGALAVPTLAAIGQTYKMSGKIVAIDLEANTVVVDVPIGKKKVYCVAGPLAPDAVLKKGTIAHASLKNFKVGDKVIVEWKVTDKGHLVKMLSSK